MAEGKHTPGEWTIDPRWPADIETADGLQIAAAFRSQSAGRTWQIVGPCPDEREALANARLIAAAPCLLEALKHIADPEMMRGEWVGNEMVYRWIGAEDFQDIARAAIAKATAQ